MSCHTINHYANGHEVWIEFECIKCGVDMDFFDFEMRDWLDAAENQFHMRCPSCQHSAEVRNITPN